MKSRQDLLEEVKEAAEVAREYFRGNGAIKEMAHALIEASLDRLSAPASPWRPIEEGYPKGTKPVLLTVQGTAGAKWVIRAMWAAKFTVTNDADDDSATEYCEEKDEYYLQEGWYEHNECEELHWRIDGWMTPLAWQPLPPAFQPLPDPPTQEPKP